MELRVRKRVPDAQLPTRTSEGAAGYDLYSSEDTVIPGQGKTVVKTGISIALPDGCYGRIAPRSGLAAKHHIDIGAGVVDKDYRGEVGVVMFNLGQADYKVSKGDRIAQLVLERIFTPPIIEVEDLDATARGEGGFGSTGYQGNNLNNFDKPGSNKRGLENGDSDVKKMNVSESMGQPPGPPVRKRLMVGAVRAVKATPTDNYDNRQKRHKTDFSHGGPTSIPPAAFKPCYRPTINPEKPVMLPHLLTKQDQPSGFVPPFPPKPPGAMPGKPPVGREAVNMMSGKDGGVPGYNETSGYGEYTQPNSGYSDAYSGYPGYQTSGSYPYSEQFQYYG